MGVSEGFKGNERVRPLRSKVKHLKCGTATALSSDVADVFAKDPGFYGSTFCAHCHDHFRLTDPDGKPNFVWEEDGQPVGA